MEFPQPDPGRYIEMILTVVIVLAVLQYVGLFSDTAGEIDFAYTIGVALLLPIFTYLWTVLSVNVDSIPDFESMTQNRQK